LVAISYPFNSKDIKDTKIITDDPAKEASDFKEYSQKLSKIIIKSDPKFTVGIYGGWGTGKTTLMQSIKEEIDNNYSDIATTIWFDSWRYEREKYSLMIPLLRTIILTLENAINDPKNESKQESLRKVKVGFTKMLKAIVRNLVLNIGLETNSKLGNKDNVIESKLGAGFEIDIGKVWEEYKSEGNVMIGQQKIFFHKHISDILKEALYKVKEELKIEFRLVIFIDNLDRCTPDRALEILESIKTFFDIEGIIYVIAMDPLTIDPIINTKYGNNPKIDGMHYLQKIVQLPFQIPVWNLIDLSNIIGKLVKEAGLSESYSNEILKETNQELIIKAIQLNPRDIKRFINSIVLAKDVYGTDLKDIEKIIAIQAFYFHGHKLIEFLKQLIPYEQRIKFLMHFILLNEKILDNVTVLNDLAKVIEDEKYDEKKGYLYKLLLTSYRADKLLNNTYKKLIETNDNDLFTFLKIASIGLLKIDNIDNYLRVIDNTGITNKKKDLKEIDSKKQFKLLQSQKVIEFNEYSNKNIMVHLPYSDLPRLEIPDITMKNSLLFKINLTKSNLSRSNLIEAVLSMANLRRANLSGTNLVGANLNGTILTKVSLNEANLSMADLSGAILIAVDLTGANLSNTNFTNTILINNIFSENTIMNEANFKDAIIDKQELIDSLHKNQCQYIPEKINNKEELKLKIEGRKLNQKFIQNLLNNSMLSST
jgi:hypothetical protein